MSAGFYRVVSALASAALILMPLGAAAQTADDPKRAQDEGDQATLSNADREALAKLQGIWTPIEVDGDPAKTDHFMTFTIEGQKMGWPGNPGSSILIDTSVSPARIDFVAGDAGDLGYLANIFKLEGDTLTLCRKSARRVPRDVSKVQGPGPTKFDPSEGQLVVLERARSFGAPTAVIGFEFESEYDVFVDFDGAGRAAIAIGPHVLLWDLEQGKPVGRYKDAEGLRKWPSRAVFLPDGERLAICRRHEDEPETAIWNPRTNVVEARLKGEGAVVSPDGESLLTWDDKGTLRLYDANSLEFRHETIGPGLPPDDILFLPNSRRCVVYGAGEPARIHDTATGAERTFDLHFLDEDSTIHDAAIDRTGERLWALEQLRSDFRVVARAAPDFDVVNEFQVDQLPQAFAVAPDGRSLYLGSYSGTIDQVDAEDGDLIGAYRPLDRLNVPLKRIERLRVSPDGSYLAAISGNVCYLWNLDAADDGERRKIARWPERTQEETDREAERSERFVSFPLTAAFAGVVPGETLKAPQNLLDEQDKPTLSWRVRSLAAAKKGFVEQALRKNEPWDSEWNRRAVPLGADVFRWSGVEAGKTTWQLATGPTTVFDGAGDPAKIVMPSRKILLVETAPERAVVWSEPRDFVFDPKNPRARLPEDGFHFRSWNGSVGYIRADIPDDLLRRMFAAEGEIADEEALPYVEGAVDRLFR